MENFRKLLVWQRAMRLAVRVHEATRSFTTGDRRDLQAQMRRSARGVHASIAEACGRKVAGRSNKDPLRVFAIASGELHELDSDIEYCGRIGYLTSDVTSALSADLSETRRMLAALIARRRRDEREE